MSTAIYTLDDFKASLKADYQMLLHLYGKIPADRFDYRLTEKQRSVGELLEYLSYMPWQTLHVIHEGTAEAAQKAIEPLSEFNKDKFEEHTKDILAKVEGLLDEMTEDDFQAKVDPFGMGARKRGVLLVDMIIKFSAAYKMQLFLYLKSLGLEELNSMNVWMGRDAG